MTKQLAGLVTTLPVDPLLVRPQWPTMDADETIAAIKRLGTQVVPAIARRRAPYHHLSTTL